jgi:type IX secretion system PorP/SprF family membrane protein
MKGRIYILLALVLIASTSNRIFAQGPDIHFSQYNASPLNLNPAFAGLNSCRYRVNANFRMQYARAATNSPFVYHTGGVGFDINMGHGYKFKNFAGFGFNYYSDISGDLAYSTHKAEIAFAYHIMLNRHASSSLSLAAIGGLGYRYFNAQNATFDSQFEEYGFNPAGTREVFDRTKFFYGDVGVGALWNMTQKDRDNYYVGAYLAHLNQPKLGFYYDNPERLFMKFTVHAGASVVIKGKLSMLPSIMYLHQGPSNQVNFGTFVRYQLGYLPQGKTAVYLGAWARVNNQFDALVFAARADIKGMSIGFSYDINTSKFAKGSGTIGGPELSIMYGGCFKKSKRVILCPVL